MSSDRPTTTPPGVVVRPASVADAVGLARVHVASWQAAYAGIVPADFLAGLDVSVRAERWQADLAGPGADRTPVAVALRDDVVVGFAAWGPVRDEDLTPDSWIELYAVYVHPSEWGAGVGRLLWAAVAGWAGLDGRRIALWVLAENARAQGFYAAVGLVPDGTTRERGVGGALLHEVRFTSPR